MQEEITILQLPIHNCISLIMVTVTSHIFINIFQTVHFSALKFTWGNEKNMNFLLIPKSQKIWKKSEAMGPDSFKTLTWEGNYLINNNYIPIQSLFAWAQHKNNYLSWGLEGKRSWLNVAISRLSFPSSETWPQPSTDNQKLGRTTRNFNLVVCGTTISFSLVPRLKVDDTPNGR